MFILRPACSSDLTQLAHLAAAAGVGLTTLPNNPAVLAKRLHAAEHAFRSDIQRPSGEHYLFVMEDLLTGELGGCCGIMARVGGYQPFYSYALKVETKASEALAVHAEVRTLHLRANHQGPSEIGTLFLMPSARGQGLGRLVSLARFLFMGAFPQRFATRVIAEMRGVVDPDDSSPFWEAIGRHFFAIDFARADARSAADKQFIADLMPRHPIYIPMLPAAAQAVIGQVHHHTRPALKLLEQEGFEFADQVDIFDAGPMVQAKCSAIRTLRDSRVATLSAVTAACGGETRGTHLISNERLDFRACRGTVTTLPDRTVTLPRDLALALGLRLGDRLRSVEARAPAKTLNQPRRPTV